MPEYFSLDDFSRHLDSKFLMHYGNAQTADLKLITARDEGSSSRQIQFSLIFLAPVDAPPSQGIYKIEHEALGELNLFLVPIGKGEDGLRYEAVFNRFIK